MPDITGSSTRQAALDYAEMGWPVLPGAIWHNGHFADPADETRVIDPCLRPPGEATTDAGRVGEWWSKDGRHQPNVLTITGSRLGAFMVAENLVMTLADDPRFAASPTPVLAFPNMPIAYFLVRPPMPSVLQSRDARVVDAGLPLPLPPSALDTTSVMWLITPGQAGNRLIPADALADQIQDHERKTA
ncbi:bifunctional DNA primase/polymerase [Saccharothrix saharensis]|uniref:bifunctional DNA primase/polymerase n=1 Tax=Saccharothrix saharensis TaxID=571190 RepID=UPI00368EB8FF